MELFFKLMVDGEGPNPLCIGDVIPNVVVLGSVSGQVEKASK